MTEVEKEQVKMTSSSPTERPNPKLVRGRRKKTGTLDKFKAGECNILPCTDVASRGLDIPSVDTVINYDIPTNSKDYIHQVGRTARAGRSGVAISLVNRYELEWYIQTEKLIGKKLRQFPAQEEEVLLLLEHVTEAKRISQMVWTLNILIYITALIL